MLRAALVLTSLLVWVPAQAHFSLLFSGATGQPASWQEGAFTVTGNWTPDGGVTIHPGQLETGSWLQGDEYIASYQGQNSNWVEISRQGVGFTPISFSIAERSGTQTLIASTGQQITVTGAVGDLFFFPSNDINWTNLDWLVLHTSTGSLGIDNFMINVCPDPKIWGPYNVAEGGGVMMYSYAEGSGPIFNWDLDADGVYDEASGTSTLFNASLLDGPATQTVGLEVTADCGLAGTITGTTTSTVNISNVAPIIDSLTGDNHGDEGSLLSWNVIWSDPGLTDSHTILWEPGDGSGPIAGGNTFSHSYQDQGSYTLSVTITDNDSGSSTDSLSVSIDNHPPILSDLIAPNGGEGQILAFSITVEDPGPNDILSYSWDFGDGSSDSGSTTTQHAYADDGSYTVTFTASDQDGGTTTISSEIIVSNLAPGIDSLTVPAASNEGDSVVLSATASDVANDSLSYTWDFGDGSPQQVGNPISYAWLDEGNYTVHLTVSDDGAAASTASAIITVNNLPPSIVQVSIPSGPHDEGSAALFSVQASDPGDDTLSYLWDFGDGSPTVNGDQTQHSFPDEGSYSVSLIVSDGDGGSDQQTASVDVLNVAPLISAVGGNTSGLEGQTLNWTAQVTDPGNSDVITGTWDFGDGSPVSTGLSASHAYADDGSYTLIFQANDNDGALSSETLTVTVNNEGPSITSLGVSNGVEGETLSFTGAAVDAGNDILTYSWDFGDGSPPSTGTTVSHAFSDDGSFSVSLTVSDEDSGSATAIAPVFIANLPPQIQSVSAPNSGEEGELLYFSATASDPSSSDAAALVFTWNFGDGSPIQTGANLSHSFPDNDNWQVIVTASDDDGGTDSSTLSVLTSNVSPTITSQPPQIAHEGVLYNYLPSVHEPSEDSLTWTLAPSAPLGMALDSSNGRVSWTPEYTDTLTGAPTLTLFVHDDDGAMTFQSWTPTVLFADGDGDGLADSWEILHALDPNLSGDELLDLDGDGLSNLDEFLAGTDPNTFDGPGPPALVSPTEGEEVATSVPWLEVEEAFDPQGDVLTYQFEVYSDAALTQGLAAGSTNAAHSNPRRWKVTTPLPENTTVFWRARAEDAAALGSYSGLASFFVNSENESPTTPQPLEPADGDILSSQTFALQWLLSEDIDKDRLSYLIEVRDEQEELVEGGESESIDASASSSGIWTISTPLEEDKTYSWRVASRDEHGSESPWSSPYFFQVSQVNTGPENCRLIYPTKGQQIDETSPLLIAEYGYDIDSELAEVLFELDVNPELGSKEYSSWTAPVLPESGNVQWDLEATGFSLSENRQVFARLRCFDVEGASSVPHLIDFFVRGENEPPQTPTAISPLGEVEIAAGSALLEAVGYGDPEGDLHFFEFVVARDEALEEIVTESGPVLPSAVDDVGETYVSWNLQRVPGDLYWSVSGVDEQGARSSWSPSLRITFSNEPEVEPSAAGCRAQASPIHSQAVGLLPLLAFAVALRRRKTGLEPPETDLKQMH
jgi:PKD repeat protein